METPQYLLKLTQRLPGSRAPTFFGHIFLAQHLSQWNLTLFSFL